MYDVILLCGHSRFLGYQKPAGTYKIATELRNNGYSVQCIDLFNIMNENTTFNILKKLISSKTVLLGISTTLLKDLIGGNFFGIADSKYITIIDQVRTLSPNIKIAVGGSQIQKYSSYELEPFKEHIDYCISGQGEMAMLAILNHITNGSDLNIEIINGIAFTSDKEYPYDQFNQSTIKYQPNDIIFPGESLCIEVARGCVFRCAFCHRDLVGKNFGDMTKHAEVLQQELIRNYELFGTTDYYIVDDTINDSVQKVEYLHKIFTNLPFKIRFSSFGRLDLIWKHPEMASMLQEMGMTGVIFGIETLHKEAGRLMGKGLGEERIKTALQTCRDTWKNDVNITANFIAGLPKEPIESIYRTFDWLSSEECPIDCAGVYPLFVSRNRNKSRIDKDTGDKFKCYFSDVNDQEWKHEHLSYSGAIAMRQYLNNELTSKWPNYFLFNAFSLPRYTNIGISIDESLQAGYHHKSNNNDYRLKSQVRKNIGNEILDRTLKRRKDYIQALLNHSH